MGWGGMTWCGAVCGVWRSFGVNLAYVGGNRSRRGRWEKDREGGPVFVLGLAPILTHPWGYKAYNRCIRC